MSITKNIHKQFLLVAIALLLPLSQTVAAQSKGPGSPPSAAEQNITLSFDEARAQTLAHHPELKVAMKEEESAEGRLVQAGLGANPSLDVDLERSPKTADKPAPSERTDVTITISQEFELGGKKTKRLQLATFEKDVLQSNTSAKRADVISEVKKLFVDVAAAQERVALAHQRQELAKEVLSTANRRKQVGKASTLEVVKAEVALAASQSEAAQATRALDSARRRLALSWGSREPSFQAVRWDLDSLPPLPPTAELEQRIARNPDVSRWAKERSQRLAALDVERSKATPDVTMKGGVKRSAEGFGFLVGISIPLPINNRNQGSELEAIRNLEKIENEQGAAEQKVRDGINEAQGTLAAVSGSVVSLRSEIVPGSTKAFELAQSGYRQGRLDYLEVLDAQKTLFEAKTQYLEALVNFHKAYIDLQRLTGEDIANETSTTK